CGAALRCSTRASARVNRSRNFRFEAAVGRTPEAEIEPELVAGFTDDRQAETRCVGPAIAMLVAAEPPDGRQPLELRIAHARSVIGNPENEAIVAGSRAHDDPHAAAGSVVAHGVVDEIGHDALDERRVGGNGDGPARW